MRILIDECLPKKLKQEFVGHTVATVQEQGWSNTRNSALLRLAAEQFEVLVTVDQNLEYQRNLRRFTIAVIVLAAANNRFSTLRPGLCGGRRVPAFL